MAYQRGGPDVANTFNESGVSVGATSTLILAANDNRKEFSIVNDSDEPIYLSVGGTAVMNSGKRINANGGVYYDKAIKDNDIHKLAIYGICSSGGKNVTVSEGE